MASIDLTIRGAGIFGLSVAWEAVSLGAKVHIVDPNGVGAGASGGVVGALAPHVPENWNAKKAFQLKSLLYAERFWSEVEDCSGLSSGYARLGRLQPILDAKGLALAEARMETAQHLWQGAAHWDVRDASEFENWGPGSATGKVIFDTLSARIHPAQACQSLAKALTEKGVEFSADAPDVGAVLWATGAAGLRELSACFDRTVGVGIKGQAALLDFDARNLPQLFIDGIHYIPHQDGTLAIGSTTEREFHTPDETDKGLDDLLTRAREHLPMITDAPLLKRWAGLRPRAKSRAPLLGDWPGREGHFVANGGFKIGFGMAPRVGQVMAAYIVKGEDMIPKEFRADTALAG